MHKIRRKKLNKLSAKKQRQWVHVFNSCWERNPGDEKKCHMMAWGVVKKASSVNRELVAQELNAIAGLVRPMEAARDDGLQEAHQQWCIEQGMDDSECDEDFRALKRDYDKLNREIAERGIEQVFDFKG